MSAWGSEALAEEPAVEKKEGQVDEASQKEAEAPDLLESISVTATRVERPTQAVPEAISVVSRERIEKARMQNIKEVLSGTPGVLIDSKNGGYDARLVIRGAGQKAPYGVREITILRDGVPMTDPDSFSRLDFIDTQDIERIEITKGPGSIYSTGSAGGTIQILSKSVFDTDASNLKVAGGTEGAQSYHLRYGGWVNESHALTLTASRRVLDNDWRRWNEFDTNQVGVKHGVMLGEDGSWETELSYSEADLQLPNSMSEEQFDEYRRTGSQEETQDAWKHSGRYSKIWFFNTRYEKQMGDVTFKPRFYFNHWSHYHPVTGAINDSPDNMVYGTDLELSYNHHLLGNDSLVAGLTVRQDLSLDAQKYEYKDVETGFGGRISATLSDEAGDLLETEDANTIIYGLFMQESLNPSDRLTIDLGFRLDQSRFAIDTVETSKYDYSSGVYVAGDGDIRTRASFTLFSPKAGLSYALTPAFNLYGSISQGDQVPSNSEVQSNPEIDAATSRNYEIGVKGRGRQWSADLALYYNPVEDEIVSSLDDNGETVYQNAGRTDKQGVELSLSYLLDMGLGFGGSYAYSDYTFEQFQEVVNGSEIDRSGNRIPFVPEHQASLFLDYNHPSGFKARLQSDFWGEYEMDNANTEQYGGYDFLTSLMVGYEHGPHSLMFNADNIFDKRYATEVKKDTRGKKSYYAGAPQSFMLTYSYRFGDTSSWLGEGS
ncbi:MAG: TonB-dependent receptor [Magnetococcales bacterium]|nr:TonB-dependent receptor [Magnetococcales bacterium]